MTPTEQRTRAIRDLEKQRQDSDALANGKAAFRRMMGGTDQIDEWITMATKAADKIVDDSNAEIRRILDGGEVGS